MMVSKVSQPFISFEDKLNKIIVNYDYEGLVLIDGDRNKIKLFELDSITINIKSFKIPNFINKIIYRYFRESKAARSFLNAKTLIHNHIGTPEPIAYFEEVSFFGLKKSYYLCKHLDADFMFRDLVENENFPDCENILRQFIRFSFNMHEKGIEFLDHSPGNTLVKKRADGNYDFFLIDLNRMNFHEKMDFDSRMKNLSRLVTKKEMISIMSEEYAVLYHKSYSEVFEKMWHYTIDFQEKFWRKRKMKKKLIFWK
nr:lipopolysaccharide kinase InaA family protein [uncultured Flavobacterium sp.]